MVAGRSRIARRGRFRHLLWRTPHDHHIYKEEDVRSRVPQLMAALGKRVPAGAGRGGIWKAGEKEFVGAGAGLSRPVARLKPLGVVKG